MKAIRPPGIIGKWKSFHESMVSSITVDDMEESGAQRKRIEYLELHPEEWFKYYFPEYCPPNPLPFR